jgi:hypothetical protein
MKQIILISLLCIGHWAHSQNGNHNDTVFVADFKAVPYSYENAVTAIQAAIEACRQTGAKVLSFEAGRYDIWPEGALRREYYISNTSTEKECPSKVKTIGMLFENMKDLTIDGKNALLMYHGEMTTLVFDHCENMTLKNIRIDFERPAASEVCYTGVKPGETEVRVHPDTQYEIVDGKTILYGEGWKSTDINCIQWDPEKETFTPSDGWKVLAHSPAREVSPGIIRFATPEDFTPKMGNILTMRDIIRDQVGMFIRESSSIRFRQVNMHYMHGLGIVSQFVTDVTMEEVRCIPRAESNRVLATSADMMHFSGCRGKVTVKNCHFQGAQDDPINIHGTNLRIVEKIGDRVLKVRFMHGQSYGFDAFFEDDEIAFVRAKTMERFSSGRITATRRLSEREILLMFEKQVPADIAVNLDCIENMTWTPEVEISGSYFTRTSTRGLLVTTPRKVVIENNTFYKTGMSAILIEGDAKGWFESGPVCDVTIRRNTFVDCAYQGGPGHAVIALHPSNTVVDPERPVHRNVRIENNTFHTFDYPVLYAKSTAGLYFLNNTIIRTHTLSPSPSSNPYTFFFNGCKDVVIQHTTLEGDVLGKNIRIGNMKKKYIRFDKELRMEVD